MPNNSVCLLSIIIPCFNSSRDIIKTISKTPKENRELFEFVIVDDCSNEEQFALLKSHLFDKDLNIRIYKNEKNVGPGGSRNHGIKEAYGKYVTFLDSDDYFADDFFLDIFKELQEQVDLVVFDYNSVTGNRVIKQSIYLAKNVDFELVDNAVAYIRGAPWGKIYKKEILIFNNVHFLDLRRNEDMPFTKVAVSYCKSIKYLKRKHYYNYVQNSGSLSHNKALIHPQSSDIAFEYISGNINPILSKDVLTFIAIKDYFYAGCLSKLEILNRKEWNDFVDRRLQDIGDYRNNIFYKKMPLSKKIGVNLIRKKRYNLLKLIKRAMNK